MGNWEWDVDNRYTLPFENNLMFLKLDHQNLRIYGLSRILVLECYKFSRFLPPDERFGMVSQIRRAALSVHLNIAEGASRQSVGERKRFYEISRSSLVEIDAAFDLANDLNYTNNFDMKPLEEAVVNCFKHLCGMLKA